MKTKRDPRKHITWEQLLSRCVEDGDCLRLAGSAKGVPTIRVAGVQHQALRVAYALNVRISWSKLLKWRVWVVCGNRHCINPNHAMHGTAADNRGWLSEQGRLKHHPATRLKQTIAARRRTQTRQTPELAEQLRASEKSTRALAKEFGLSLSTVAATIRGDIWRNPDPVANPFAGLLT